MPINPLLFANKVAAEFRRYLLSAFPMTDPDLAEQAKAFLSGPTPLEMPLVKGPYVTLSESFASGDPVKDLADRGILHPVMPSLIGYPKMYKHQQQVFEAAKSGKHVLVSTGTGSGKTEAFLYPIIDELLRERDQGIKKGLSAILIYPMNALANDQLDRLREMLGGTEITFGQWIGSSPATGKSPLVDRAESSSRNGYLAERKKRLEEARKKERAVRPLAPPEECLSEQEIREREPRILITNYRQLEILTTRVPDVALFANSPLKYMVYDEAHTYSGATGAEVACLTRRVRSLASKTPEEVICIGTSATLTDPEAEDNDQAAKRFAGRFFGVDETNVELIGESYVERQWPRERYKPTAPTGDFEGRLNRILAALNEPVDKEVLKTEVQALTGQSFDPGDDWQTDLFNLLISNDYTYQCSQTLKHPQELLEAGWRVSNRVQSDRMPSGLNTVHELLSYLILSAAACKEGGSLLRPKVHFFIRGLDKMVVAFDREAAKTNLRLFPSLVNAKEHLPDRRDDAFWSVLVCRACGQHFFEGFFKELNVASKSGKKLKIEGGNAQEDMFGEGVAYWSPSTKEDGTRLVMTNRLLEELDEDTDAKKSKKYLKNYLCRQCGAIHSLPGKKCLADGCGHEDELVEVLILEEKLKSCPTCGNQSIQIGGNTIEPARPVKAVVVADVHILAQSMINNAPPDHQKLVVFADSRQDAAFQAGWMQDHGRRIRLRHLMYEVIKESRQELSFDQLADKLQNRFRKEKSLIEQLYPEIMEEYAESYLSRDLYTRLSKAIDYSIITEFSAGLRRREVLESMGLVRVNYQGLDASNRALISWADNYGLSPEEAVNGVSLLIDGWRRGRMLYISRDPIYSKYHAKDDPYILAGLLPLREFRPEGLILNPRQEKRKKYWNSIKNSMKNTTPQLLLKLWSERIDNDNIDNAVEDLWNVLVETEILVETDIRSQRDKFIDRVYQVNADKIRLSLNNERHRCKKCQRIMPRPAPNDICTRRYCKANTVHEEPDFEDYNVSIISQPFSLVSAEEHTAQVPGEVREKIEQEFKSKEGKTNCLVATPTLELGVNIGALDMVLLRNVPPLPANYWQRAGRAGREERMAVIGTYCRPSQHDRYFFQDPLNLLTGEIEAPVFNMHNPLMIEKHVHSALLTKLQLRTMNGSQDTNETKNVLNKFFPNFIRDYLLDEHNHYLLEPLKTTELKNLVHPVNE